MSNVEISYFGNDGRNQAIWRFSTSVVGKVATVTVTYDFSVNDPAPGSPVVSPRPEIDDRPNVHALVKNGDAITFDTTVNWRQVIPVGGHYRAEGNHEEVERISYRLEWGRDSKVPVISKFLAERREADGARNYRASLSIAGHIRLHE